MKLPGISYGQVQSLGRQDTSAPMRAAAAETQATEAWNQAMQQGVATNEQIRDDIAIDKSREAMNVYHEEKLAWGIEQGALDENGEKSWGKGGNGHTRFNNGDDAARSKAGEILGGDTRAQLLFDAEADRANVQYGAAWLGKVKKWGDENYIANLTQSIDYNTKVHDYDGVDVDITTAHAQNRISAVQKADMTLKNNSNRVSYNHTTRINASTTVSNFKTSRAAIEASEHLGDEGKKAKNIELDNHIIQYNSDNIRQSLSDIEEGLGLNQAVVIMDKTIHALASMTEEDQDGFTTEKGRQSARNAYRAVWGEWKARLNKSTKKGMRDEAMACAKTNTCYATTGKTDDKQKNTDHFATSVFGWSNDDTKTGYNKNGVESAHILADDARGEDMRARSVDYFKAKGYIPKPMSDVIDAGYTHKDPKVVQSAVTWHKKVLNESAGAAGMNMPKIVKEFAPITSSFEPDVATGMLIKYRNMTPTEVKESRASFNDLKLDQSGFDSALKAAMPEQGHWFFNSTPQYRDDAKKQIERMAQQMLPMTGNNIGAAYTAALGQYSRDHGRDEHTKTIVKNPIATSVFGGEVDGGKWAIDEAKVGIKERNGGEMPDNFTYTSLPDFDPETNRKYAFSWVNDEGQYMVMGYDATFEYTERGQEYFAEQQTKQAEIERQRQVTIEAEKAKSTHENWMKAKVDARSQIVGEKLSRSLSKMFTGVGDFVTDSVLPGATVEKLKKNLK